LTTSATGLSLACGPMPLLWKPAPTASFAADPLPPTALPSHLPTGMCTRMMAPEREALAALAVDREWRGAAVSRSPATPSAAHAVVRCLSPVAKPARRDDHQRQAACRSHCHPSGRLQGGGWFPVARGEMCVYHSYPSALGHSTLVCEDAEAADHPDMRSRRERLTCPSYLWRRIFPPPLVMASYQAIPSSTEHVPDCEADHIPPGAVGSRPRCRLRVGTTLGPLC
jgi:hypothetical protein